MNRMVAFASLSLVMGLGVSAYAAQTCRAGVTGNPGTTQGWCQAQTRPTWKGFVNGSNCTPGTGTDGACRYDYAPSSSNSSTCNDHQVDYYNFTPTNPYAPCPAGSGTGSTAGCTQDGVAGSADIPVTQPCM